LASETDVVLLAATVGFSFETSETFCELSFSFALSGAFSCFSGAFCGSSASFFFSTAFFFLWSKYL